MPELFDVTVIGAGPGGYVAIRAPQFGLKTALIEKNKDLGRTYLSPYLSHGCIPTREFLHSAQVKDSGEVGISVEGVKLHFDKVMARKSRVIASLSKGLYFSMKRRKITVFNVTAGFEDRGKLTEMNDLDRHVTGMMAEACLAMGLEAPAEELGHIMHAHPTLPEAVMEAAEAVHGKVRAPNNRRR